MKVIANHSDKLLKLDLQYFSDEDFILPDDFVSDPTPPEVDEPTDPSIDPIEPNPTDPVDPQTQEPVTETQSEPLKFKVKYNKEEKELSYDDAVPLIQKGMNFDKSIERAKQEARDTYIAEQGYEWNGKPITTEAEYHQALQEQALMEKYQSQNLPEDVIQELIENRKFRQQFESERKNKSEEEEKNAEFQDFFQYFKQANGRDFDTNNDQIPTEVWEAHANGVPLRFAYMEHQNKQLANQIKVLKQNEENSKRAPISGVTTHGGTQTEPEDDFIRGFNSI